MAASYELWDTGSGNIIGSFASLDECLDVVKYLLDTYGLNYAQELDLGRREDDDQVSKVVSGDQLIAMLARPSTRQRAG